MHDNRDQLGRSETGARQRIASAMAKTARTADLGAVAGLGGPETGGWRTAAEVKLAPLKLELAAKPESMIRSDVMPVLEIRMTMTMAVKVVPVNMAIEAERVTMKISAGAGGVIA